LAFQDEFFVNNPLDANENDEHALDFVLHLSRLFSVSVGLGFPCTAHAFYLERLSNHRTFFETCTKFEAVLLSDPSRNSTRIQIKGRKKSALSPS
jgi:hypothetical protein